MALQLIHKKFDKQDFEKLFREWFVPLTAYAHKFINDHDSCKEIVHDVFINLWEKKDSIDLDKSVKSYLYTSVHNRCLNHIRDNKKFARETIEPEKIEDGYNWDSSDHLVESELQLKIKNAIDQLPEKCREVFLLSRFEELKYNEIAAKLDISVKTVEAQMSKALKIMREKLSEYVTVFFISFIKKIMNTHRG